MMDSRAVARAVMATAAASQFRAESLAPGKVPSLRDGFMTSQALFERVLEQMIGVVDNIWLGTPHNLNRDYEGRELAPRIAHEHPVL